MRNTVNLLFILLLLPLLLLSQPVFAEIRVIKVSYSTPDSVAATLKSLFGDKITVSSANSINAVIVNCSDSSILKEIDKLALVLDKRPAVLRFTVKRDAESEQNTQKIHIGHHPVFRNTSDNMIETSVRSIIALEYKKARFTEDNVRIFSIPTYWGEATQLLTTSKGLMVSGHLIDQSSAQIEIWYSSGEDFKTETMLTSLLAPIGQWVSIGGLSSSNASNAPQTKLGRSIKAGQTKSSGFINRRYLFKIDLVSN